MRGREGTGQHAQRMTRLRRPGCGRLQRVGSWGGGVLVWKSPPGSVEQLTEGFPGSPTFWEEMPIQRLSILPDISPLFLYQGLTSGNTPSPPPAPWTSPLPVSRALSVRSPRALMSRKGLFPMPMETICCTRSSREQRPCLLLSLGSPASVLV